jgi:hypothetical protein
MRLTVPMTWCSKTIANVGSVSQGSVIFVVTNRSARA